MNILRPATEVRPILEKPRLTIRKAAAVAEKIGCQMPETFALMGNLIHFAAFKRITSDCTPGEGGAEKLKADVLTYRGEKET